MTYDSFLKQLAKHARLTVVDVRRVMDLFRRALPEAVAAGDRVTIPELGTFRRRLSKGRIIRNPQTKELQSLPASVTLAFKASKHAKRRVQ